MRLPQSSSDRPLVDNWRRRMADPNWFYSTLAQSSAAIVGLAGGFMVTRGLAQRTDIDSDRTTARALMLNLYSSTVAQRDLAKQVQASIRKVLPIAENTG